MRRTLLTALAAIALAQAPEAAAQTAPSAGCGPLFHVLHDDRVGALTLPAGRYRIVPFGPEAPDCHTASDLLRQFLEDWDGRLPNRWVVDAPDSGFLRGDSGFTVLAATPAEPDAGGGGRHPANGAACNGLFQVLHDDFIGDVEIPAGRYRITVLSVGRLSCAGSATLFAGFLQDFAGDLPGGWELDPQTGTFARGRSHHIAFRVKEALPDEANADRGTHPARGANRCPASFRVRNNDRIGDLRLRAGRYRITSYGRVSCTAAASLFADFLEHPEGDLPRPWRVDPTAGGFWRGSGTTTGFRVKPMRFRGR